METWSITNLQHLSTTKNLLMNQRSDLMSITSIKYIISILSGSHHVTFFANALRPCANVENCNNFWYSFYWWDSSGGCFFCTYLKLKFDCKISETLLITLLSQIRSPNSIASFEFYSLIWIILVFVFIQYILHWTEGIVFLKQEIP